MEKLRFSRIYQEFTIFFVTELSNRQFTINSLLFSGMNNGFSFCSANSLSNAYKPYIHYLFRKFTMNSLSVSRLHHLFHYVSTSTIFFANSLWILYLFRKSTMNSFSFSLIHYENTIFFSNSLWIQFRFRKFTIFLANSLWIHLVFRDSQWIRHLFRKFTMDSLSFSRIKYESICCFVNTVLDVLQVYSEFSMCLAN